MTVTNHADAGAAAGIRDESFLRLVEQMRQYFSLADFLPVGVDATSAVEELSSRVKPTIAKPVT